jgi:hypothetical protein
MKGDESDLKFAELFSVLAMNDVKKSLDSG